MAGKEPFLRRFIPIARQPIGMIPHFPLKYTPGGKYLFYSNEACIQLPKKEHYKNGFL